MGHIAPFKKTFLVGYAPGPGAPNSAKFRGGCSSNQDLTKGGLQ